MINIKKTEYTKYSQECETTRTLTGWWYESVKWYNHFRNLFGSFFNPSWIIPVVPVGFVYKASWWFDL